MKYYIDFEATQFDENIINIGCICENGKTFSSLVKPYRMKNVTKFITNLTGITQEMLEDAPDADTAFSELWSFILTTNENYPIQFFCYGDSDGHFIERTLHHMTNLKAIACAAMIKGLMVDYSAEVTKYFHSDRAFSLRNVFCLVNREDIVQKHDALEDAKMLQSVVENMKEVCAPADVATLCQMPGRKKNTDDADKVPVPHYYSLWNKKKAWTGYTDGDENNWMYKCTNKDNNRTQYFCSIETAALWFMRYFASQRKGGQKRKPSSLTHRKEVEDIIQKSIESGEYVHASKWEVNNDRKDIEENV